MELRISTITEDYPYIPCLTRLLRGNNDNLYTVASCGASYNRAELYTSEDNGVTWSQEIIVTDDELEDILGGDRRIVDLAFAVDSHNDIHVLLHAYRSSGAGPTRPIMYMKRTTGFWSIPIQIEAESYEGGCWVAIDANDRAHIVFEHRVISGQYDIYYNSVSQGGTWGENEVVASAEGFIQRQPIVKVGPSYKVYACWESRGWGSFPTVFQLSCRPRVSGSWRARIDITDTNINHAGAFAVDHNGTIHIFWEEQTINRCLHNTITDGILNTPEFCGEINSFGAATTPTVCMTAAGGIYLIYFELISPDEGFYYYIINYLSKIDGIWQGPYSLLSDPNLRDAYPRSINDYYPLSSPQNINIPQIPIFTYAHRVIGGISTFNFAEFTPKRYFAWII